MNVDTDNDRPTLARVYRSLRDICPDSWNLPGGRMPTGLGYDFLRPVEDSGINDLKHYYFMADLADGQPLGRANLYSVCFDLATTDRKLTPAWRTTIKRWFPGFMTFRFLECGLLTMVSNPLALRSDTDLERVLPVLAGQMDQLAHDDGSDFLMIRDVDPEHYQRYLDILRPLGFRPALGFSRVDTTISWSSVEEALGCLSHKRRLPLKTSLEFRERFGIEVEELDEYAEHAPVLARLWRNVKTEAKDYQREDLNPEFFAACSRHLHGRSRLWLFRYQGTPIAFFLNVWGADENYILLEWGIDRDFEHYRKANLYRAALMLSLKDAISRDKRRMEMGITNYFTKLRIPGARVIPTIYFLRHSTDPVHTATLARMMMHNIQRPTLPDDMSEEFCRWEERIRLDQDGLPEHDIFRKIDRQHKYTGLKLGGVYGFYPRFTGPQRSTVKAAELGEIVLLGTNSYLGLATHPEVVEASAEATRRYGTGCSGSPLLNGTLDLHVSLEQELACFLGKPAAVLCSTGYQSNLAAISALCESGDMIIQDALNHRSLFDAARLSGADFTLYRHNDMDHLARVLRRTEGRRRIIVVDAVFSMEGTVADLATIAELADRHGCRVYVDESHALGVLGPDGRGASAALGVLARMDVVMGPMNTLNSASLVNKGLEVIETHLLFGIPYDRIDVVVHPQSIIHSMVTFIDGSTIAQASPPDMKLPISLALGWPRRVSGAAAACDFHTASSWEFEPLDTDVFPAVELARQAGVAGGCMTAVYNAANEEAAAAFLAGRIGFPAIVGIIADVLHAADQWAVEPATVDDVLDAQRWARERAQRAVSGMASVAIASTAKPGAAGRHASTLERS